MKYTKTYGFETGNVHRDMAMNSLLDMQDEELLRHAYKIVVALWREDKTSLTQQALKRIKDRAAQKEACK